MIECWESGVKCMSLGDVEGYASTLAKLTKVGARVNSSLPDTNIGVPPNPPR